MMRMTCVMHGEAKRQKTGGALDKILGAATQKRLGIDIEVTDLRRLYESEAKRRVELDGERVHPHPGMPKRCMMTQNVRGVGGLDGLMELLRVFQIEASTMEPSVSIGILRGSCSPHRLFAHEWFKRHSRVE